MDQNHLFYQRDMETMTVYQKNFLIAVANGINSGLSRREVLNEYHLESSANVQGVKKALIARDFITPSYQIKLPSNQLILYLNIQFYSKGYYLALVSFERFGILLSLNLLCCRINTTIEICTE